MTDRRSKRRSAGSCLLNLAAGLVALGSLAIAAGVGAIIRFPGLLPPSLRPLPTEELSGLAQIPTSTATIWAPTEEPTATPTQTPILTRTPTPTPTPTLTLTLNPEPTATGPTPVPSQTLSVMPYTLQGTTPVALPNVANDEGCNWMGIAGLVFDLDKKDVPGLIVRLTGGGLDQDKFSGSSPEFGPSGYQFFLSDHPVETDDVYRVQLLNDDGEALSRVVFVDTFDDCSRNLLLVNFVQNH